MGVGWFHIVLLSREGELTQPVLPLIEKEHLCSNFA